MVHAAFCCFSSTGYLWSAICDYYAAAGMGTDIYFTFYTFVVWSGTHDCSSLREDYVAVAVAGALFYLWVGSRL